MPDSANDQALPGMATETDHRAIGRRVAKGAAWMVVLRFALRGISVASQLVLVRLLAPEDFGVMASASVIYSMLDVLSELSTTLALVQMKQPEAYHYDTAWTMGVLRGLLLGVVLLIAAPLMGAYMQDARVTHIVEVLAIVPVVQGFESIGLVTLQRRLQFERLFLYRLANKLLGFLIAIPMAIVLHNYWALLLGGFAGRIVTIPLSYLLAPHRVGFSLRGFADLFNFSKWLFLNNILIMAEGSMMTMTLGRLAGVRAVGLYQVSYDLAALPASEIAAPVRAPMYAGYARVADNAAALRVQVLDGLGLVVMIVVPMSVGIAVVARQLVALALGAQWADAGPVVALCALYALFDAIGHFTGNVYIVRNAQRSYVTIMACCLVMRLALVVTAAAWGGLVWAAAAMTFAAFITALVWFAFMRGLVTAGWRALAAVTWRSFAAALAMAGAVLGAEYLGTMPQALVPQLGFLVALGAAVHVGAMLLLWQAAGRPPGPEHHALHVLRALRARLPALS